MSLRMSFAFANEFLHSADELTFIPPDQRRMKRMKRMSRDESARRVPSRPRISWVPLAGAAVHSVPPSLVDRLEHYGVVGHGVLQQEGSRSGPGRRPGAGRWRGNAVNALTR